MHTIRPTTGALSDGSGRAPKLIAVAAGLHVKPCDDGSGEAFVEGVKALGLSQWDEFDAIHRGVRVPLADCA